MTNTVIDRVKATNELNSHVNSLKYALKTLLNNQLNNIFFNREKFANHKEAKDILPQIEESFNKTREIHNEIQQSLMNLNNSLKDLNNNIMNEINFFEKVNNLRDVISKINELVYSSNTASLGDLNKYYKNLRHTPDRFAERSVFKNDYQVVANKMQEIRKALGTISKLKSNNFEINKEQAIEATIDLKEEIKEFGELFESHARKEGILGRKEKIVTQNFESAEFEEAFIKKISKRNAKINDKFNNEKQSNENFTNKVKSTQKGEFKSSNVKSNNVSEAPTIIVEDKIVYAQNNLKRLAKVDEITEGKAILGKKITPASDFTKTLIHLSPNKLSSHRAKLNRNKAHRRNTSVGIE